MRPPAQNAGTSRTPPSGSTNSTSRRIAVHGSSGSRTAVNSSSWTPRRARACDIETSGDFGIQNTACGSMPPVGSQWVLDEPSRLTLRDADSAEPALGEVVLEVVAAGICGSDLHGYVG